ncbi:MAG: hypothetical protein Q9227_006278 [Pyrenula ochraceoflavens]
MSHSAPTNGSGWSTSLHRFANGTSNGNGVPVNSPTPILEATDNNDLYDLVCIGFGPASLAIAIALHDAFNPQLAPRNAVRQPKVRFLERQQEFGWHAGMQLPGAKMQISFLKDLATLRDPRSDFTFLNYLHSQDRLVQFSNLGTFLPSRLEFEDYMRWCAGSFTNVIDYAREVFEIYPAHGRSPLTTTSFVVKSNNVYDGSVQSYQARHIIIATGGSPRIPTPFPKQHPKVIHTSGYRHRVPQELPNPNGQYHIAVIGGGQSAAETFHDLHSSYPNARTTLILKNTALRPSDDSPLYDVNEIFDPSRVDPFFEQSTPQRTHALEADKSTNYGVVRLELLETIYADLYHQRIKTPNERDWQHRILRSRAVQDVQQSVPSNKEAPLRLTLANLEDPSQPPETLQADAIIVATGYSRDSHNSLLTNIEPLRAHFPTTTTTTTTTATNHNETLNGHTSTKLPPTPWRVSRNYKLQLDASKVSPNAGIWLQGCNESTHGLSDTLLSILATRGGEIVESIFGELLSGKAEVNGEI